MDTAKIFWTGRSQAVRLPREFRFEGAEVRIRKVGNSVILEPVESDWDWLDTLGTVSADFMVDGRLQPAMPNSPPLFD